MYIQTNFVRVSHIEHEVTYKLIESKVAIIIELKNNGVKKNNVVQKKEVLRLICTKQIYTIFPQNNSLLILIYKKKIEHNRPREVTKNVLMVNFFTSDTFSIILSKKRRIKYFFAYLLNMRFIFRR